MSESFTLYKLIILYMLEKVDFPLTTSQISEFILDKGYTNYFKLQSTISEMLDSQLILAENTHNRTLYHLTEEGSKTIEFFRNKISPEIQHDIDDFLEEKSYDLKEEAAVKTEYYLTPNSLIYLKLTVTTKKEAETIANNWNMQSQSVYASLLAKLL